MQTLKRLRSQNNLEEDQSRGLTHPDFKTQHGCSDQQRASGMKTASGQWNRTGDSGIDPHSCGKMASDKAAKTMPRETASVCTVLGTTAHAWG